MNDPSRKIITCVIERYFDDTEYELGVCLHRMCQIESANNEVQMIYIVFSNIGKKMTANELPHRLNIPIEMAKKTLKVNTELAARATNEPTLVRKYRTNDRKLRYARMSCDAFTNTFFAAKDATSVRGFKVCQVFVAEFGHIFTVPMKNKSCTNIAQAIKKDFKKMVYRTK